MQQLLISGTDALIEKKVTTKVQRRLICYALNLTM